MGYVRMYRSTYVPWYVHTYKFIEADAFHGNRLRKEELKMICAEEKFLRAAKLSNSPFQNVDIVPWGTYICIDVHTFQGTILTSLLLVGICACVLSELGVGE